MDQYLHYISWTLWMLTHNTILHALCVLGNLGGLSLTTSFCMGRIWGNDQFKKLAIVRIEAFHANGEYYCLWFLHVYYVKGTLDSVQKNKIMYTHDIKTQRYFSRPFPAIKPACLHDLWTLEAAPSHGYSNCEIFVCSSQQRLSRLHKSSSVHWTTSLPPSHPASTRHGKVIRQTIMGSS